MNDLGYHLGLTPLGALAIVVSTILMYFTFGTLLALSGQRLFSSPSSLDLAVVTVLGAIVGRAILGQVPTLSGGLLALSTLVLLETTVGRVRRSARMQERVRHRAVALMVHGRPVRTEMRRHHVDDLTLWSVLRTHGVRDPAEVALVVLEKNGRFSVLRAGAEIHPAMLTGVRHANEIRAQLHGSPRPRS